MNIFKKHKKSSAGDMSNLLVILEQPKIIKEAKIKPTTCTRCQSVYQAKKDHIKYDRDFSLIREHYILYTKCPVCREINNVEFEITEEGGTE